MTRSPWRRRSCVWWSTRSCGGPSARAGGRWSAAATWPRRPTGPRTRPWMGPEPREDGAGGPGILWGAPYLSLSGGPLRALAQLALSLAALVLNPKAVRHPLKENMAGVDLTEEMLARLDKARSRIFLLGGSEKEIQGTRGWIEGGCPDLNVVGARNGYFDVQGEQNEEVLRTIDEARPDVLLVAMGFPRQEKGIGADPARPAAKGAG